MMQDPFPVHMFCIAGYFLPVNQDLVPALDQMLLMGNKEDIELESVS